MNKLVGIVLGIVSLGFAFSANLANAADGFSFDDMNDATMFEFTKSYPLGPYWKQYKYPDGTSFKLVEQGNYIRTRPALEKPYIQLDILDKFIPGHWDIQYFDPDRFEKLSPAYKKLITEWKKKKWPLHTIQYHVQYGKPLPPKKAFKAVDEIWIGDSMPEAPIYRFDLLMEFLHTGKWRKYASSTNYAMWKPMTSFLTNQLLPILKKELPFCQDPKHKWTRKESMRLFDIFVNEFTKATGRPVNWTMWINPWFFTYDKSIRCVAAKGADAFLNAQARGIIRQSGGDKLYFTWRGHEPTERLAYATRNWQCMQERDDWGYPLPLIRYYIFRPFLIGGNYSMIEEEPHFWYQDIENDGQYELTPIGRIGKELVDFAQRHPDRGVPYAPVALLKDYNRYMPPLYTGTAGILEMDDADFMTAGLMNNLLFMESRQTKLTGGYFITAPYGEIFDILSPNTDKKIDPNFFKGYKVLFALGGVEITKNYAEVLKNYVSDGGTLVINYEDAKNSFDMEKLFGVKPTGEYGTAKTILNTVTDKKFKENEFTFAKLAPTTAKTLYSTNKKNPIVTDNKFGRGHAILIAAKYMTQNAKADIVSGRGHLKWRTKPLLKFVPDFISHLTREASPFEINVDPEYADDISWLINKKGDGWTVTMFNYSLDKETKIRPGGTACVIDDYPYKRVPFEIVCKTRMKDVMELFGDRNVKWNEIDGQMVVSEDIACGNIRVYEFQPHPIVMSKRTRFANLALNRPVKASSFMKNYEPYLAVDGFRDNSQFWQSGFDQSGKAPTHSKAFPMPQWLEVDLGAVKEINHAFIQFHVWKRRTILKRQYIYRYFIEASPDGKEWTTIIDERKNMDWANPGGLERWFEPVKARYVKVTVLSNTANAGAQVVELEITGADKETYLPERKSITLKWQVEFPAEIANTAPEKITYLTALKPLSVKPGWLPPGRKWEQMNGGVRLYADKSGMGSYFKHSIYGESVSEIVYTIPSNAVKFVSAIGFGAAKRDASVEFKVFVDGEKRFDSGIYRFGQRVLPVVVNVKGAKKLKLIVTDGGDSIVNDYAWWGDARFIKK